MKSDAVEPAGREVLDALHLAVALVDSEDEIVFVNRHFRTTIGCGEDELPAVKSLLALTRAPDAAAGDWEDAKAGRAAQPLQWALRARDGSVHEVHAFVSRFKSFRVLCFHDGTGCRRELEDRAAGDERFRVVFEAAPLGIAIADGEGRLLAANPFFFKMLGYQAEDLPGLTFMDITFPDDRETTMDLFKSVCAGERSCYELEKRYLTKSGKPVAAVARITAVRDGNGRLKYWIGIMEDITLRKTAEKERRRLESRLYQIRKLESIGTLAGGIAHDFNNLMTGMLGNASLMLQDKTPDSPDFERLNSIIEYVESGRELTGKLLAFARGGKYEPKPASLNRLLERTTGMLARTRKDLVLHKSLARELWNVSVDAGQVERVLMNLLVNASQAMPDGGDLFVRTQRADLDEALASARQQESGRYAMVEIRDTGVGMDRETLDRVFDPFFSTRDKGRGTGLGLASAEGIVRSHGGFIEVDSQPGQGATFRVYLPATREEIAPERKEGRNVETGSGLILLVDDEEFIRKVGSKMLERLGYEVLTESKGKAAVETYAKRRDEIALVILDLIMPAMGGEELFAVLKQINPDVKVLVSSGYSSGEKVTRIMDQGCDGFLAKPFSLSDLSKEIRRILR